MPLEKAQIKNLDTDEIIECMFNPKEYTFTKQNIWSETAIEANNTANLSFGGGGPIKLRLELFFDTYGTHENRTNEDVRTRYTDKIWELMMIRERDESGHSQEPPRCEFRWGQTWSFEAVVTNIRQTFTMFTGNGTPVRSTMVVDFLQAADPTMHNPQNPTTVAKPGYKTRRVQQGETLDMIAFQEYGDAAKWRFIADVNRLDHPSRLEPGHVLAIAPLK